MAEYWVVTGGVTLTTLCIAGFRKYLRSWVTRPAPIPLWLLLAIGVLMILLLVFLLKRRSVPTSSALPRATPKERSLEPWQEYTQDVFFGFNWYWRYVGREIKEFWIICPECQGDAHCCSLGYDTSHVHMVCSSCGKQELTPFQYAFGNYVLAWLAPKVG